MSRERVRKISARSRSNIGQYESFSILLESFSILVGRVESQNLRSHYSPDGEPSSKIVIYIYIYL